MPVERDILFNKKPTIRNNNVLINIKNISCCNIFLEKKIGFINDILPIIAKRLKILEPKIFPITTSEWPRTAAIKDVISSGKDVPNATKVIPIIDSEIFK